MAFRVSLGLLPMVLCVLYLCTPQTRAVNVTYEIRTLEGLPTSHAASRSIGPIPLIIRHDLPGKVVFMESSRFRIEMKLQVPEGRNTSEVQTEYKFAEDNETVVLQVYTPKPPKPLTTEPKDQVVLIVISTSVAFTVLCVVVSLLLYCCWWKKKHEESGKVDISKQRKKSSKKETVIPSTFSQKRRIYEAGSTASSLNIAIVVVIATISVAHALLLSPTADVIVFTPAGFLRHESKVFLNAEHQNTVYINVTNAKISVYDVPSASVVNDNSCDVNKTCHMGTCDPLTGKCVCQRGRKLQSRVGGQRCVYACEKSCPSGSYEVSSCNETHAAVCKTCRPQCNFNEFESTACAGRTDRNCTDISQLSQFKVSPNIVFEDISKVTDDILVTKEIRNLSGHHDIWLNRTSGIAVRVRLLSMDFSTTFRQVSHKKNDNAKFNTVPQSKRILDYFCKSPLPDYYTARIQEFQEIDVIKDDVTKDCPKYPSTVSTRKPTTGGELFCPGVNNSMVGLFGSRPASKQFWKEEKNSNCNKEKISCGNCRNACSNHVQSIPGCNITRLDHRLGKQNYSEHYEYCFDCCFVENCTCASCSCGKYRSDCLGSQLTCVRVKQYRIPLEASFPSAGNFKCHVEVALGPQFVVSTTLWKNGAAVYGITTQEHNLTKDSHGKSTHDFGYMTLRHPTVFQTQQKKQLVISGNINNKKFDVGWFSHEPDSTNAIASGSAKYSFHAQPKRPFGINSQSWPLRNCDGDHSGDFILVSNKTMHANVQRFVNLSAELDWHNHSKVYKVFDGRSLRRINLNVPMHRSVLRNIFPPTVIVNDRSLEGNLIRNRTFWTLRFSGHLHQCPGAFNVKLFDQDRPTVEVYNYDAAITSTDCNFFIEFHLPSGGDTNLIDKQFLTKLTDSKKVIQLILVSPRYAPNFKLPEIDNEIDFDKIAQLLLPFCYAFAAMLILLISILIYGYKTRPKDNMQRDRDSKLHFRHVMFVVWFVGMRLVKSFLLTLTLILVVFSAIHHSNVKVVQRYSEFREQRNKIENDLVAQMDSHKVQEINRQLGYLEKGKVICDQKLREIDALIDAYFKEMRRRLIEDIKKRSIIYAAYKSIEKRFNEAKEKFRNARDQFNRALRTITNEINERIQQIKGKIESNFWLQAAKVMYRIIDALASIFGSGLGPFIDWVNLDVSFPSINSNLGSFDVFFEEFMSAFKKPNFTFFNVNYNFSSWRFKLPKKNFSLNLRELNLPRLNISSPVSNDRVKELLVLDWVVSLFKSGVIAVILLLLDILWFVYRHSKTYQSAVILLHGVPIIYDLNKIKKSDEKKRLKEEKKKLRDSKEPLADSKESLYASEEIEVVREGSESNCTSSSVVEKVKHEKAKGEKSDKDKRQNKTQEKEKATKSSEGVEVKRETKENENIEESTENIVQGSGESKAGKAVRHGVTGLGYINEAAFFAFKQLKKLNYQVTKTNLVPMCLLWVMGLFLIYIGIITAKYALTVDTLDTIGYFDLKMAPLLITRKIVNTRITSNAFVINEIQLPYYEKRVNARIAFARKKADFFKGFQCTTADLHNKEYCFWIDGECDKVKSYTDEFLQNLTKLECHIPAVIPRRFTKFDRILYKQQMMKGINPYVTASRSLILNTFYTILVIIGIFVLLFLLGEVLMFLLKRLDLVRTVKTYHIGRELEHPDEENKPMANVARLKIPDAIQEKCGAQTLREGWHLEYLPEVSKTLESAKKKRENEEDKIDAGGKKKREKVKSGD